MTEDQRRFQEIMEEINDLNEQAMDLVPDQLHDSAYGYWFAHIQGATDSDNSSFCGGSMIDMASTLNSWQELETEDGEE